jgi:hypothetical protein
MKQILIILLVLTSLIGCFSAILGSGYFVSEKYDEFEGTRTVQENINHVYSQPFPFTGSFYMNMILIERPESDTRFGLLQVKYMNDSWLFIPEGNSLKFIADGEVIPLYADDQSSRIVGYGGHITEMAYYNLDRETAYKIASAQTLKAKVHVIDFPVSSKSQEHWKSFIETRWIE